MPKIRSSEGKRAGCLLEPQEQTSPTLSRHSEPTIKILRLKPQNDGEGEESHCNKLEILRAKNDCYPQNDSRIRDKNAAFTLAEVLITLGIIGVVAAMTLPALIQKYNEKQIVTALKKNYSVLYNAFNFAVSEYGDTKSWQTADVTFEQANGEDDTRSIVLLDNILPYLKILKDCGYESKGCFSHKYKQLNGYDERDFEHLSRYRKLILNDGTLIAFHGYETESSVSGHGEIWVDINGKKGPNICGKDMFLFRVDGTNSKIIPYGGWDNSSCKKNSSGYACASWILLYENMDYLHQ